MAEKLSDWLKKGEDLTALARQFSDDPGGRERGGEYVFPVNRMVPELETAIAKMPTNQVSGVIATPYALHLVKVVERLPGELTPFEEVRRSPSRPVSNSKPPRLTARLPKEAVRRGQGRVSQEALMAESGRVGLCSKTLRVFHGGRCGSSRSVVERARPLVFIEPTTPRVSECWERRRFERGAGEKR